MLSGIKDAIVAIVAAVNGVHNVYGYLPEIRDDAEIQKKGAVEGGAFQMWTLTRESTAAIDRTVGGIQETHLIVLRGLQAIAADNSASDAAFEQLLEDVRSALRADRTLTNTAFITNPPPSVRVQEPRVYAGILVNYGEIAIYAQEYPV